MTTERLSILIDAKAKDATREIDAVSGKVKGLGATTEQTETALGKFGLTGVQTGRMVRVGATMAGGAMLAGLGLAVHASMGFEKSLSGVKAVSGATSEEMGKLRSAALEAGAATTFSASQAADAEGELAKAGVSTSDILGGALRGSMNLAAAGGLDLAQSATIAAQAMNVFGLHGKDVGHIADVLAAGANKSAADVGQLGDALMQGGLVAKQTGLGLEDTVGVLSMFADNALVGSDAGTSLKTMLQRLTPQSQQAADEMKTLGISAYDSQGRFVGLAAFAENLKSSLSGLSAEQRNTALTTIFGSDAVRGASILMDQGAKGVREYTRAVNDQGAAARMANTQMDNLSGDLEQLKGSIETALIQTGSGANGVLRTMTQTATGVVNAFGSLPEPVQASSAGFLALAGGGLLVVGAIGKIAPAVKTGIEALRGMKSAVSGMSMSGIASSIGRIAPVAIPATIGLGALSYQMSRNAEQAAKNEAAQTKMADAIIQGGDAAETARKGMESLVRQRDALLKTSNDRNEVSKALFGDADGLLAEKLKEQLDGVNKKIKDHVDALGASGRASEAASQAKKTYLDLVVAGKGYTTEASTALDTYKTEAGKTADAEKQFAAATKNAGGAMDTTAGAVDGYADATENAKEQTQHLQDAINTLLGIHLDEQQALIDYKSKMQAVTDSFKENGATLDINTEKGRANASATIAAAQGATSLANSIFQETGDINKANFVLAAHVGQLGETLRATGMSEDAVVQYMGKLYGIPPSVLTTMHSDTDVAAYLATALRTKYDGLQGTLNATAHLDTSQVTRALTDLQNNPMAKWMTPDQMRIFAGMPSRQMGGPIPGTKGTAVPILAHGGEYVLSADVVDRIKGGRPSAGAAGSPSGEVRGGGMHIGHLEISGFNATEAARQTADRLSMLTLVGALAGKI